MPIASSGATGALRPIAVSNLSPNTVADFDLYIRTTNKHAPVLYRSKEIPLTQSACDRLAEGDVVEVYVDASDEPAYYRHIEKNLRTILTDAEVSTVEKSETMYSVTQNLLKEAFSDPRTGDIVKRSTQVVESNVAFLLDNQDALFELMKVASFDYYTYTHSVNVFMFSVSLAQRLGMRDREALYEFGLGALLHDVGKYRLDPSIINSRGNLTSEQWDSMKMHPVYGEEILVELGGLTPMALDVVRHHHEKQNGTGYPDGLTRRELSSFVRMSTIADIFDALTTRRSYKGAIDSYPALKMMREKMWDEIDRDMYNEFVQMIAPPQTPNPHVSYAM